MAEPFFCLRVDLSALPWEDAREPVVLVRLLGLGRTAGLRFHAFATPEVLRAYPAYAEAILGEGHDLDPLGRADFGGALPGHVPLGCAVRAGDPVPTGLAFVSGAEPFPVLPLVAGELGASEFGAGEFGPWVERTRAAVRGLAARGRPATLAVPAGLWGGLDPRLDALRGIVSLALAAGLPLRTLREVTAAERA